ncbi:MAG: hypothetical protein KatS3mg081_2064 [Gemmatimonadales bacterium]|nr:MAG: hypothetical protein KatS3mg081_2064 [Gemmatimonadales bacterium]
MRWYRVPSVLAVLTLFACAPSDEVSPAEQAVEEQVIRDLILAWERGVNSLKWDSVTMFYHKSPDMVAIWSDGRRTEGWEAESTATAEFLARTTALNFDVQEPSTQVLSRRVALTTFRHAIDLTDSLTGRQLFSGYGTLVWIKDPTDNRWKIHARQISRNPPPAEPARQPARRR